MNIDHIDSMTPPSAPSLEKYDRQLRLWGSSGQKSLMQSRILMLGSGPTASEALKNLILPGIQCFTIIDHAVVSARDVGNNFFLTTDSMGKNRAKAVMELLQELNPDVTGSYRHVPIQEVILQEPEYFQNFDLVIAATQVPVDQLLQLSVLMNGFKIPFIIARAHGLIGYLRVQLQQHTILDSKADGERLDLRITNPFPELQEYATSFDVSTLESMEHAHVPYVVILIQLVEKWKQKFGLAHAPKTFEEKQSFKELIQTSSRGQWGHEVNFVEAYNQSYHAYESSRSNPPHELEQILAHSLADGRDRSKFWIFIAALKLFREHHALLFPLNGYVPDMTSTTETFVHLQHMYHEKAQVDLALMKQYVADVVTLVFQDDADFTSTTPTTIITSEEMECFCKKVQYLQMIEMKTMNEEYHNTNPIHVEDLLEELDMWLEDNKSQSQDKGSCQVPGIWYLVLRVMDAFYLQYHRFPESTSDQDTVLKLRSSVLGDQMKIPPDYLELVHEHHFSEWIKYQGIENQGMELHNISSVLGGMVAQEAIKVLTHQFVPLQHTYVYNGITGQAQVYDF